MRKDQKVIQKPLVCESKVLWMPSPKLHFLDEKVVNGKIIFKNFYSTLFFFKLFLRSRCLPLPICLVFRFQMLIQQKKTEADLGKAHDLNHYLRVTGKICVNGEPRYEKREQFLQQGSIQRNQG